MQTRPRTRDLRSTPRTSLLFYSGKSGKKPRSAVSLACQLQKCMPWLQPVAERRW